MKKLLGIIFGCFLFASTALAGPILPSGGQALDPSSSPTFTGETVTGLTASKPVFTDGSKALTSSGTVPVNQGGTGTTGNVSGLDFSTPPAIGSTTPAAGYFSPSISKGPAIITTFAGTVTATASTTVTFSSAADAILAGYSATNPVRGTILISNALTRYIVSWTNATTCVVDSPITWAGTAITSVQLPIATFVNSAGVTKGWMNAAGNTYFVGNVGVGMSGDTLQIFQVADGNYAVIDGLRIGGKNDENNTIYANGFNIGITNSQGYSLRLLLNGNILMNLAAAGGSAAKVLAIGEGTAPTTAIANGFQTWSADYNGGAGDNRMHVMAEGSAAATTAIGSGKVSIKGAVTSKGGFTRQLAEATSGGFVWATGSIAVNVPSGARILGVQLRVDTLITSDVGTSWAAIYVNTPTTAICALQAFAANTKFDAVHPAYEITTGTVTITLAPNAGTFTAGVVRAIVYYEAIDAMGSL